MRNFASVLLGLCLSTSFGIAQTTEIAPADNLVVDGIPAIPASLVERIGRYSEFRGATLTSWHPVEREMLISTRFGDTGQAHVVKFPGGARRQMTYVKDSVTAASYPPAQADYFVFTKDTGGDEFFQFYRYDVKSGDVTLITDGKSRNTGRVWSHRGNLLAHGSTRRNGTDVDLYTLNPLDPRSGRMIAQLSGGGWSALDWSPDDRTILAREYISINESNLWLIDVASGAKTLLTPKIAGQKIAHDDGEFSKDGKGIYVTTDRDSEFLQLAYVELATKKYTYLSTRIAWDVEGFDLSPDDRTIAFSTNEDGFSVLRLLDTATGKEMAGPPLPSGVIAGLRWHNNGRDLGFSLQSARTPSDVYSLDVGTGKIDRWTESETGGLNTETFVEPELIRWRSFDGKMIAGLLYRPSARFTGKRPVIINIHGGPEGQDRPVFRGRANYYTNELGVALIYPNVRGSTGYGKTFLQLDNGLLRDQSYKDIEALLDWIEKQPALDSNRVMATGVSYGGHMTLAVATFYSDRIRCAVDVVGISNLVTFLEHTQSYRRDLRRSEYGDERDPKMREYQERIAPMNNLQKIKKPLMVVAGKNDPRVPLSESEQIVSAVKRNGSAVWYLMAKDEGHGFAKKNNQDFQFYATVLFVQQYLMDP